MILKTIGEVVWMFYSNGKPKSDKQDLGKEDIIQMCRMAAANNFRQQYLYGQKIIPGRKLQQLPEEAEYYFLSPLLSVRRFVLSSPDELGMRRVDMGEFDLYRLPKNNHFTNIYMVNGACTGQKTNQLTLVKNGEEKFYQKPKFNKYIFGVVVGRGINTYHVPPCVEKLDVETTYDSNDVDITMDIAFDVAMEVLKLCIDVDEGTGDVQTKLREEMKKQEEIK